MKLVFNKVNDETIDVFLNINQQNQPFDYGEMILKIYEDKTIEDAEISGTFTDIEVQSIKEMIADMRKAYEDVYAEQEETVSDEIVF